MSYDFVVKMARFLAIGYIPKEWKYNTRMPQALYQVSHEQNKVNLGDNSRRQTKINQILSKI